MSPVLMDTVGFLSLWNGKDPWHPAAAEAFNKLAASGSHLFTTTYILLECGNSAARTRFRFDVVEIRRQFALAGKLIEPTSADVEAGWESYARGEAASAGIVHGCATAGALCQLTYALRFSQ